ncbi:DUF1127 domain-containing protein [Roseomonas sp. GC11]|uniref:DUF1127 domain-containing protein n=1 Tax=Roseomonas sp. GC11 TaxID=2950546 RepID=UPI00210B3C9D|nr:DUF1127 domain-containing protein [Roseomonas sp. GC11]MCQ4161094.1 DUF1127 domain-containing protein [Roseomonas sp. GC11]
MYVGAIYVGPQSNRRPRTVWERWLARLELWARNRATRAALRDLTPEQLRDIGVTGVQARFESCRHFWD